MNLFFFLGKMIKTIFILYCGRKNEFNLILSKMESLSNLFDNISKFGINCKSIYYVIKIVFSYLRNKLNRMFKEQSTLHFNYEDKHHVYSWITDHLIEFKEENVFSIIDKNRKIKYHQDKKLNDLLITEPNENGNIYFKNNKIYYEITDKSVTLFHYNKNLLDTIIESILDSFEETQTKEEVYKPEIYIPQITENKDKSKDRIYSWRLYNKIHSNVKLHMKNKDEFLLPYKMFYEKKELYDKIGLDYKFVSLFKGSPGLGKTTSVKYIAQTFSKNIYIFDHLDYTSEEFKQIYDVIPCNSVILFDDFDKLRPIDMTYNRLGTVILNILDGVFTKHGSFIIFCLNNDKMLEKIIPTITRKGRIDYVIDFDSLPRDIEREIISDIYNNPEEEDINEYLNLIKKDSNLSKVSFIKNHCLTSSGDLKKAIKSLT